MAEVGQGKKTSLLILQCFAHVNAHTQAQVHITHMCTHIHVHTCMHMYVHMNAYAFCRDGREEGNEKKDQNFFVVSKKILVNLVHCPLGGNDFVATVGGLPLNLMRQCNLKNISDEFRVGVNKR